MTTTADILLVQRAHASGGRDAAIAEIRRRWPMIAENVIEATLERVLAAPVDPPPSPQKRPRSINVRDMSRDARGRLLPKGGRDDP